MQKQLKEKTSSRQQSTTTHAICEWSYKPQLQHQPAQQGDNNESSNEERARSRTLCVSPAGDKPHSSQDKRLLVRGCSHNALCVSLKHSLLGRHKHRPKRNRTILKQYTTYVLHQDSRCIFKQDAPSANMESNKSQTQMIVYTAPSLHDHKDGLTVPTHVIENQKPTT